MKNLTINHILFLSIIFSGCNVEKKDINKMNVESARDSKPVVLYSVPGMDKVIIKKEIPYTDPLDSNRTIDIYYPPKFKFDKRLPTVLVVCGFNRQAMRRLGRSITEDSWYISWGKLIAASGMAAILYETDNPEKDLKAISNYIQNYGDNHKIDTSNIGIYACSGHVPLAISYALNDSSKIFKCAVLYYGLILTADFNHISSIDSMAKKYGFANPRLGPVQKWRVDLPILFVRAGLETTPNLNDAFGHFYNKAITQNLPIIVINYSKGVHGFEALNDNDETREIIKRTIDFWKFQLK